MADNWYIVLELEFDPPVEDEKAGISDSGNQRQKIAGHVARGQGIDKETQDPRQYQQADDTFRSSGTFMEEHRRDQDHEHRHGELKNDRVTRGRQLVGHGIQDIGRGNGQSCQDHMPVDDKMMLPAEQKDQDRRTGQDRPGAADGHRVP